MLSFLGRVLLLATGGVVLVVGRSMVVVGAAGGAGGGKGGVIDLLLQVVRRALEYLVNPAANDPRVLTRTLTYHYLAAANMKVLLWPWNLCSEYVTVTH